MSQCVTLVVKIQLYSTKIGGVVKPTLEISYYLFIYKVICSCILTMVNDKLMNNV